MGKKKEQLKIEKFMDTSKLVFQAAPRRSSMYDSLFDALGKLKKGQSFIVPVPKGVTSEVMQNRTNAALRRGPVKPPAGCVFRKNVTADGKIAVCCLAEKEATSIYKKERRADQQKPAKKASKKKAKKTEAPAAPSA